MEATDPTPPLNVDSTPKREPSLVEVRKAYFENIIKKTPPPPLPKKSKGKEKELDEEDREKKPRNYSQQTKGGFRGFSTLRKNPFTEGSLIHDIVRAPSLPFLSNYQTYKQFIFEVLEKNEIQPFIPPVGNIEEIFYTMEELEEMFDHFVKCLEICLQATKEYKNDSPRHKKNLKEISQIFENFLENLIYLNKIHPKSPHLPDLISFISGYREISKNRDAQGLFLDFIAGNKNEEGRKVLQALLERHCSMSDFALLKMYYPSYLVKPSIYFKKNSWIDEKGEIYGMKGVARSYLTTDNNSIYKKIRVNKIEIKLAPLEHNPEASIQTLMERIMVALFQQKGKVKKNISSSAAKAIIQDQQAPFSDLIHWNSNGGKLILYEFTKLSFPSLYHKTRLRTIGLDKIHEEYKKEILSYTKKKKFLSLHGLSCEFHVAKGRKGMHSATQYSLWCLYPRLRPNEADDKAIVEEKPLVYFYLKWKGFPNFEEMSCEGYSQILEFWITKFATPDQVEMIYQAFFGGYQP